MLRPLHSAQTWNAQGYVCRSCQLKLLGARTQKARFHSTFVPLQETGDDWFSNFNDLSADGASTAKEDQLGAEAKGGPVKPRERKSQTRRQRIAEGNDFANLKSSLSSRLSASRNADDDIVGLMEGLVGDKKNDNGTSLGKRNGKRLSGAQHRRLRKLSVVDQEPNRARDALLEPAPGVASAKSASGPPKDRQLEDIVKELKEEFRVKLPEMIKAAADRDRKAQEKVQAMKETSQGLHSSSGEIESTAPETLTRGQGGQRPKSTHSPFQQKDNKFEKLVERLESSAPYGVPMDRSAENSVIRPIPDKLPTSPMPEFVSTPSATVSYSPITAASVRKEPKGLIERLKDSLFRPKWGGVAQSSDTGRKADADPAKSREGVDSSRPSSSLTAKTLSATGDDGLDDSPAKSTEPSMLRQTVEGVRVTNTSNPDRSRSPKSSLHNIKSLREDLSSELESNHGKVGRVPRGS